MSKSKVKTLVVIPYLAKAAQGKELFLSVAGWRKHFKCDYHIVIVGDWHPVVDTGDDISFINCPRVRRPLKGNYWAHIDHVNKFRTVMDVYPDIDGFIYTCDDIYAVKDFTLSDVKRLKVRCREIIGSYGSSNAWVVDNYKTKKRLMKEGLPVMNWVCHLPVWYDCDRLKEIYDRYKCGKKSYVVENLYFNTYHANDDYIVIEEEPNDYQFKIWNSSVTVEKLKEEMEKKVWICNSVRGWNGEFEDILAEHYAL